MQVLEARRLGVEEEQAVCDTRSPNNITFLCGQLDHTFYRLVGKLWDSTPVSTDEQDLVTGSQLSCPRGHIDKCSGKTNIFVLMMILHLQIVF